jgi:hypothetical protein
MRLSDRYQAKFGIKQPLRGYQLKAAALGVAIPNYALLMAPRLGKTRIDIAVTGYRFLQDQVHRWVIVCPSIAKDVWKVELENTLAVPHEVTIVEGKADERKLLLKTWGSPGILSILILNPEASWRLKKLLYKVNPDKITIDESHRIKNHAAKQSGCLHNLGKRADYRTIMTGTFMTVPTDVFSQFKFLDPTIFGTKYKRGRFGGSDGFLERYAATFGPGGFKPKTYKNLDELSEKVAKVSYQLTREQAGGFPLEQYQNITFELTNPAKRHYQEMFDDLKTEVTTSVGGEDVVADIILTRLLRLQQVTSGFLPSTEGEIALGSDRIDALRELVEEYPVREPLVILCRYHFELRAVDSLMGRLGRSKAVISGKIPQTERDRIKHAFQDGEVDTVVAQVRSVGIAIDLSRSRTAIFYSTPQSLIDYDQAKARVIARTGGSVSIIHLVARGTVDEEVVENSKTRGDLVSKVLSKINSNSK